nr:hypothetical protein Itr_chr12CG28720 [Ipomoea trifida]
MKIKARIATAATSPTTIAIIEPVLRRGRDAGDEPEPESAAGFECIVFGMASPRPTFSAPAAPLRPTSW